MVSTDGGEEGGGEMEEPWFIYCYTHAVTQSLKAMPYTSTHTRKGH